MTFNRLLFVLGALILFAIGFDLWNPHGDTDWVLVAWGLIATGLALEGHTPVFWSSAPHN